MNTQEAYINGFIKRATEYGLTQYQAIELLKRAAPQQIETQPGGRTAMDVVKGRGVKFPPANPVAEPAAGVSAASKKDSKKYKLPIPLGGTTG